MKELSNIITKLFCFFFSGVENQERSNSISRWWIFCLFSKWVRKGDYSPVSLLQCLVKIWRRLLWQLLRNTQMTMWDIGHSQHSSKRSKFCLTELIFTYVKVSYLVDKGKPVYVMFLDFSSTFNNILLSTPLKNKMSSIHLVKKRSTVGEQLVVGLGSQHYVNGFKSGGEPVIIGVAQGSIWGPVL